jgi:phosphohistidine phosphatase
MLLYILRHADADTQAATDDERRLSEKGARQAEQVGRFCDSHGVRPALILTSPVRRALQTARIVAEELEAELREARWLACGAEPADVAAKLSAHRNLASAMIVGHEPDLGHLIAWLLGVPQGEVIRVRKASLTALEVAAFRQGGARLDFSIPVKFM